MTEFLTITCPHCSEDFQSSFDADDGSSEFIADCEVCCRPMNVKLRVRANEVEDVQVAAA